MGDEMSNVNSLEACANRKLGQRFRGAFGLVGIVALVFCIVFAFSGCSSEENKASDDNASLSTVRIGTMPTEDFLPMWAAEKDGYFEQVGIEAQLTTFDSAQALSAAIAAGEIDMAMVDVPRAVKLCESGTPVTMEWITLGTDASQGAFGVMASADAPYSTLKELKEYMDKNADTAAGVGVAANTVPEYVFDMLCEQEGIDSSTLIVEEVASLPERYSLMVSGNLAAAALPGSLLRLGEASGMKILAEDTTGDNISQSVMIATQEFASENMDAVNKVAQSWDMAAEAINANPSSYIELLAENANLNEAIADTYPISTYPMAFEADALAYPAADLVEPQLEWMKSKGYISKSISYDQTTGMFTVE